MTFACVRTTAMSPRMWAIVDIDNEVRGVKAMPGGAIVPAGGVVKTQLMEVFVRREGQWWIEAYHNVDVKPTP